MLRFELTTYSFSYVLREETHIGRISWEEDSNGHKEFVFTLVGENESFSIDELEQIVNELKKRK